MFPFDPVTLPATVAAYFATWGTRNALELSAPDAIIVDEGDAHEGLAASISNATGRTGSGACGSFDPSHDGTDCPLDRHDH